MDKEIKVEENLDCSYSGSTAVVVVKQVIIIKNRFGLMMEFSSMRIEINGCYWKQGDYLVIGNLGDSRAVMGRITDDGGIKAIQLTTDLKPGLPSK